MMERATELERIQHLIEATEIKSERLLSAIEHRRQRAEDRLHAKIDRKNRIRREREKDLWK